MQITRSSLDTAAGPGDWFTGAVFIDTIAAPSDGSRLHASNVHFTPGARTAWHTHPNGQTIWVTEGVGHCQRRGGPIEVIRPGDRVFFEPGEEHWHGAAATASWLTSPCSRSTTTGNPATWLDHVSDEEYAGGAGRRDVGSPRRLLGARALVLNPARRVNRRGNTFRHGITQAGGCAGGGRRCKVRPSDGRRHRTRTRIAVLPRPSSRGRSAGRRAERRRSSPSRRCGTGGR